MRGARRNLEKLLQAAYSFQQRQLLQERALAAIEEDNRSETKMPSDERFARVRELCTIIAPLLLGVAVGVSGLINLRIAEVLLIFSALGFWLWTCIDWAWKPGTSVGRGAVETIDSAIVFGSMLLRCIHYLRIQVAAIEAKHLEPEYPQVLLVVRGDKIVHLTNRGKHDLSEVTIMLRNTPLTQRL
jgi:hypothetical protein